MRARTSTPSTTTISSLTTNPRRTSLCKKKPTTAVHLHPPGTAMQRVQCTGFSAVRALALSPPTPLNQENRGGGRTWRIIRRFSNSLSIEARVYAADSSSSFCVLVFEDSSPTRVSSRFFSERSALIMSDTFARS